MKIALFGGSFDPPHLGHVLAAVTARCRAGVDAVWVLPVAKHPYAKALSPWAQRWELCQAAFGPLGPWLELRDDELHNPSGYTFDLVTRLRAAHPQHQWALIGGSDTATDLPNWHRGNELARLIEVIAIPRRGQGGDLYPAALPAISSSRIRAALAQGEDLAGQLPDAVASLIAQRGWYR
jgi:nicotinate-nucleotide adenylyltransferase